MVIALLLYVLADIAVISLLITKHRYDQRRDSIKHRILVIGADNLAVGRAIAGLLRDAGVRTFSRTSRPGRLTLPSGDEASIERTKLVHMPDWSRLLRSFAVRRADAVVYSRSGLSGSWRRKLEITFFKPNLLVVAGSISGDASYVAPKDAIIIRQSPTTHITDAVAQQLGLQAPPQRTSSLPIDEQPLLVYTTKTKVRQRLHTILDKLDASHLAHEK